MTFLKKLSKWRVFFDLAMCYISLDLGIGILGTVPTRTKGRNTSGKASREDFYEDCPA